MNKQVDISIVIVNYNVKDFLSQCLKSVLNSKTELKIEIICLDNDSDDNAVEELTPLFPEVKFIQLDKNYGFGKANNIGFDNASGKYVLMLNPDTIIQPDTLQIMYNYMENNLSVGVSGCKVLNHDGSFQPACRRGFPTPWAAFCKLFGLQSLFPGSKLFGKYNLTYLDEDQQNYVDALIGAFMFARKNVIDQIGGFDETFFMYGEDLDICYRIKEAGYEVSYYPETTIVHFKGESAKRSTINEIKHFYKSMEIFARKHYSTSPWFLAFLKIGIKLREALSYFRKYKSDLLLVLIDLIIVNSSLLIATKITREDYFWFPDYAYPDVFVYLSIITFFSHLISGDYFESKPSIRKSFLGLILTFFILTFLTYFFRDYAFSRGILLLTILISILVSTIVRYFINYVNKRTKNDIKRILILGWNDKTEDLLHKIRMYKSKSIIAGYSHVKTVSTELDFLGYSNYLPKIINDTNINEILVVDKDAYKFSENYFFNKKNEIVKIHNARTFEDYQKSDIINEVSGVDTELKLYRLSSLRFKLFKRIFDLSIAIIMLTIGLPFTIFSGSFKSYLKLLIGKISFIGLYPENDNLSENGKIGIIGLVHLSNPKNLSDKLIKELNEYYIKNYSITLDFDIFFNHLFRRKSGK